MGREGCRVDIVIEEVDNMALDKSIICENPDCSDLHSTKCYDCSFNKVIKKIKVIEKNIV